MQTFTPALLGAGHASLAVLFSTTNDCVVDFLKAPVVSNSTTVKVCEPVAIVIGASKRFPKACATFLPSTNTSISFTGPPPPVPVAITCIGDPAKDPGEPAG